MILRYDTQTERYFDAEGVAPGGIHYFWTAFCGPDGEEIDVTAVTGQQAIEVAMAAIEQDYEPVPIIRIERRYSGLVYF